MKIAQIKAECGKFGVVILGQGVAQNGKGFVEVVKSHLTLNVAAPEGKEYGKGGQRVTRLYADDVPSATSAPSAPRAHSCDECGGAGARYSRHDSSGIAGMVCGRCARTPGCELSFA